MDDVDAVQAQIARNMLQSGDWVTAHLDGVTYLEKAPLIYWAIALSYKIFGAHDWAARIPIALSAVALCWLTAAMGIWAFGKRAGFYAGLIMATCVGLFLFTRILIPDVMLTFTVALAMWAFLRALDEDEPHPRFWAAVLAVNLGLGLLLKSLIGIVFPIAAGVIYLLLTRQLFSAAAWRRLHPFSGAFIVLLVAAPWHVLATLRNPPYFDFTLHSGPGQYHGFLWFFFINEQLLRFLNLRYPRDYDTVPRLYFWLFHLLWLFPWSVYFPAIAKLSFKPIDRAGRARLLALCWAGFILIFFTFSTTQEYYSMPCYPALALLLGSAMAADGKWMRRGTTVLSLMAGCAAVAAIIILALSRGIPTPGDISSALTQHPNAYKLVAGTHGGPDAGVVRLPASAARPRGSCLCGGQHRHFQSKDATRCPRDRPDDGLVFPRGAPGHGGLRSLFVFQAAGRGAGEVAERYSDRRSSLLLVLVDFFLYQSFRAIAERTVYEPGIWLLRSRSPGRLYRRLAIQGSVAQAGTFLHCCQAVSPAPAARYRGKRATQRGCYERRKGSSDEPSAVTGAVVEAALGCPNLSGLEIRRP